MVDNRDALLRGTLSRFVGDSPDDTVVILHAGLTGRADEVRVDDANPVMLGPVLQDALIAVKVPWPGMVQFDCDCDALLQGSCPF